MNKVYAVEVMTLGGLYPVSRVSQEAYSTYDAAKDFCENRGDKPEQIDNFNWKSERYKYSILELDVKEEIKDVILDTYNNLMICPHCNEIINTAHDWTPNYCKECGNPLSGGNQHKE